MNPKQRWIPTFVSAVLALAACEDTGTAPDPTQAQSAAVAAAVAADAALEDLNALDDAVPLAGGPARMGGLPEHIIRDRRVTYYDGAGQVQEDYDTETTASINVVVTVEGEVARDGFSASVERDRDLWVTNLEGEEEERIFNGEGSGEHTHVRTHAALGERIRHVESTSAINDVVRSVDRENHPWPLSGMITRHMIVTITNGPNGDVSREKTTVITFNGTQFASLSIDGDPAFDVDLATRPGRNPLYRRDR